MKKSLLLLSILLLNPQINAQNEVNRYGLTVAPKLFFFNHNNNVDNNIIIDGRNIFSYEVSFTRKFKINEGYNIITGLTTSLIPAFNLDIFMSKDVLLYQSFDFDMKNRVFANNSFGIPILFEGILDSRMKSLYFNMGLIMNYMPSGWVNLTHARIDNNNERFIFINIESETNKTLFFNTIFGISNYWHFKNFSYKLGLDLGLSLQNLVSGSYTINNDLVNNQEVNGRFTLNGNYLALTNTIEFKSKTKKYKKYEREQKEKNPKKNIQTQNYYGLGIGLMNPNNLPFSFSCNDCEILPNGFFIPTLDIGLSYRQRLNDKINLNIGVNYGFSTDISGEYLIPQENLTFTPSSSWGNEPINFKFSGAALGKIFIPIQMEYEWIKKNKYSILYDFGFSSTVLNQSGSVFLDQIASNNEEFIDFYYSESIIERNFHFGIFAGPSLFLHRRYFGYKIGIGYNHSFTPISRGNFEFFNTNIVNPRGTFINRGHFLSLNFTMFLRKYKQKPLT
jgi:hypothetical protein